MVPTGEAPMKGPLRGTHGGGELEDAPWKGSLRWSF
jgi:hypothetical protein